MVGIFVVFPFCFCRFADCFLLFCRCSLPLPTADWMNQQGYRSKCWQTASGDKRGGHLFRHGSIQRILGNPVYIGKIAHLAANKVYVGKQAALVPCEIFEQVQSKIGNSKNGLREYRSYIRQKALLADKLFDDKGNPYKLTSTTKKGQKFQYYFVRNGIHIPVVQLDGFVLDTICRTDLSSLDLQTDSSQIGVNEAKTCLKRAVCIKTGTETAIYNLNWTRTRFWMFAGRIPCKNRGKMIYLCRI